MARHDRIVRLIVVDDTPHEADQVINALRSAGHAVRAARVENDTDLDALLTRQPWDLLICQARPVNSLTPPRVVREVRRYGRDIPVIALIDGPVDSTLYHAGLSDIISRRDHDRLKFATARELNYLEQRRHGRRHERALRESENRARALLESSRDAVSYLHEDMHIYVNHTYLQLFDYETPEDIEGLQILDLIAVDDQARFSIALRQFSENLDAESTIVTVHCHRSDGSLFRAAIELSHTQVEGENCVQLVIRDEDIYHANEAQLELVRDYDLLTGLYNRQRFVELLQRTINQTAEAREDAELIYLVLDDFQALKARIALANSEMVIKSVAEILRKTLSDNETIARYGDQVFAIIIPGQDTEHVSHRAEQLLQAVRNYAEHADERMQGLGCSIGIARISESMASATQALENADHACTEAQQAGGNRIHRYQPVDSLDSRDAKPERWQQALREALENEHFVLFYQPIVALHGEQQELYEVLLRLERGQVNFVRAEQFIGYAEKAGMMADIDKWVIAQAISVLAGHRLEQPQPRFFIKLSLQTLQDQHFTDWLKAQLQTHDMDGDVLVFEISETVAVDNLAHTQQIIAQLKQLGCGFGLEHFGSGIDFSHSLDMLDVDYLKINGTFVENMTHDADNQAAVRAIIEMTKTAGKPSIAEFVSDANSLALLWRLGVDYAQGFYIQQPVQKLDFDFDTDA